MLLSDRMNGDPHRWALGKEGMTYSRYPQTIVRITPSSKTQVIVLSMDCRILHLTEGAGDLAHLLNKEPGRMLSHTTRSPLPHQLLDVFHNVLAILEKHIAAEDWNPFEVDHLAYSMDGTVRLRGFGIPDQARRQQSRVVLTLQRSACRSPL